MEEQVRLLQILIMKGTIAMILLIRAIEFLGRDERKVIPKTEE